MSYNTCYVNKKININNTCMLGSFSAVDCISPDTEVKLLLHHWKSYH